MEKFFSNGKYRLKKFVLGQLKTNCYLIVDKNDDCAIVDPGACDPALTEWIRANGINPRFVLLTHGHFDHVLGLKQFLSLPAYIHEFDKEMLDSSKKSSANFFNKDIEYNEENLITFSDGFKIPFGSDFFTAIHTPGHTKGSTTYLLSDQTLFTGDAIFAGTVGRYDLFGGSEEKTKQTVQKIANLSGNYSIYPGHGRPTSLEDEKKTNQYFLQWQNIS